jgi:hypothetical protein
MTQQKNHMTQDDPPIETALRQALRREPAPEGFDARILARVAERTGASSRPPVSGWLGAFFGQPIVLSMTRWATAAGLAMALIAGGLEYRNLQRERRERAAGEAAKQQLMLALRIAGSKLQLAKSKVNQINADRSGRANPDNDN